MEKGRLVHPSLTDSFFWIEKYPRARISYNDLLYTLKDSLFHKYLRGFYHENRRIVAFVRTFSHVISLPLVRRSRPPPRTLGGRRRAGTGATAVGVRLEELLDESLGSFAVLPARWRHASPGLATRRKFPLLRPRYCVRRTPRRVVWHGALSNHSHGGYRYGIATRGYCP